MTMAVASPTRRMLVAAIPALADPRIRLFLTSAALLFVELFLIRWIPANVAYVGFFTNIILVASFLGIGLGIILGRRVQAPVVALFPLLLFVVVKLVTTVQLNVRMGSADDIFIGPEQFVGSVDTNVAVLVGIVVLTTAVMAVLALPLSQLFRAMPPLRAYAIDITGSLCGIAGFTVLSAVGIGPVGWVLTIMGLAVLLGLGRGITAWSAVSAAALVATLVVAGSSSDIWSPYQRLTVFEADGDIIVNANGIPHQQFSKEASDPGFFYTQIDRWFPGHSFDNVLVIGAGTGNDVAVALKRGDAHVDAVEIDPRILELGEARHPLRPYQDPRVDTHVDDGRSFLQRTNEKYDLVILAQPDSLTLFSTAGNVRLESFLFTREAFAAVRDHLTEDGVFVLYNFYWQPWLVDRLGGLLEETYGRPPIIARYGGEGGHAAVLANGPGLSGSLGTPGDATIFEPDPPAAAPTDAWPFLYLRTPSIAPYYLVALLLIVAFATLSVFGAARFAGLSARRFSPHFFLLGAAFLLLETRSLVAFGLLFGNTWTVNALVFFAILVSVLVSIGVTAKLGPRNPVPFYAGLLISLLLAWALAPSAVLVDPPWLRYLLASLLAFSPVFFANLCFTYSFRDAAAADMAFASNLLGAVVGGLLEYVALVTGYQQLVWVIIALYAAAFLAARRFRFLADRDLSDGTEGAEGQPAAVAA